MDDIEDHDGSISRSFSHKPYALNPYNHHPNPSSSNPVPRRFRSREPQFPRPNPSVYLDDDDDNDNEDAESDELDDEDFGDGGGDFYRHPKKRRLRSLSSSYELAPRISNGNGNKGSAKGRGFVGFEEEWSERGVFALLEVWGERFVELGRRSLRSEDWRDVAERVSEVLGQERTEVQCRSMMDSLKRKYKKEKARIEQQPGPEPGQLASRWGYFRKMDALLAPRQGFGLACGVDSGEFVFADTTVYLDQSNGYDEMRDSPAESEPSEDGNGSDSDGTQPRRAGRGGGRHGIAASPASMRAGRGGGGHGIATSSASMRALADSIQKFGEIYGKIERNKRQQMMELENMRRDFCRDLDLQKKQIMERTQAEIAKIRGEEEDEDEYEDAEDGDAGGSDDLSE